jgi:hypothetical protein
MCCGRQLPAVKGRSLARHVRADVFGAGVHIWAAHDLIVGQRLVCVLLQWKWVTAVMKLTAHEACPGCSTFKPHIVLRNRVIGAIRDMRPRKEAVRTIGPAERVYQNGKLPPAIAASSSAPPTIALLRPLGAARAMSAGSTAASAYTALQVHVAPCIKQTIVSMLS